MFYGLREAITMIVAWNEYLKTALFPEDDEEGRRDFADMAIFTGMLRVLMDGTPSDAMQVLARITQLRLAAGLPDNTNKGKDKAHG